MILRDAIDEYIAWQQAHGSKFTSGAGILKRFLKNVDNQMDCDAVGVAAVSAFLSANGRRGGYPLTKHSTLAGFYRYAIARGYATRYPLPDRLPKQPSAPPYIYSRDELRRLFDCIDDCRRTPVQFDADTFRMLLLLLYGAGLRIGEAQHLSLADVDLATAILTVRDTKFYKSRLVPVGPQLADALKTYAGLRANRPTPEGNDSAFLANRDGTPVAKGTVHYAFAKLRRNAGIHGRNGERRSPCLHSFRHSFAVHRLTDWYRQGADVQRLLPRLSTYLGHASVEGTQIYLSMTPELLQQASLRFERYARGGNDE